MRLHFYLSGLHFALAVDVQKSNRIESQTSKFKIEMLSPDEYIYTSLTIEAKFHGHLFLQVVTDSRTATGEDR